MAAKKESVNETPLTADQEDGASASITYANDVVAIIAGLAAIEVEGIAGMCSVSGNILNKNRNVTKGVRVEIGTEEAAVDLYVAVEYGTPIQRAAMDAQESVRKAIESMTGLHVVRVDVHVQSVSFEKENKALQAGAESAALEAGLPELYQSAEPEDKKAEKSAKSPREHGRETAQGEERAEGAENDGFRRRGEKGKAVKEHENPSQKQPEGVKDDQPESQTTGE